MISHHISSNNSSSHQIGELASFLGVVSKKLDLTLMFGGFAFLQFTVLALANHAGEGYLSTGQRELVYYELQVFVILGFLLYAVFARLCGAYRKLSDNRSIISYIILGIFSVCVAVMLYTGNNSMFYVIDSMLAVLSLGMIGGMTHYRMSAETVVRTDVARSMGIGSIVAVVLQYWLQIRFGISPLLVIFMLVSLLIMAYILPGKEIETVVEEDKEAEENKKAENTISRRILLSILIVAVLVLLACFYNEYIHHLQIQSDYGAYNVYSWPRLMLVPGYFLFAMIGDRDNGKYVPITSLCIMLIMMLTVVLVGNPEMYWLNMCLFYCSIAAFTSYYLLTFWRLAPKTKNPALWAPFGRITDSAMVLIAGGIHMSALPIPVVIGADIAGVIVIILIMAANGDFNLGDSQAGQTAEPVEAIRIPDILSEEEVLERIREIYHLTPRETEVLRELVLTDDTQTVISERLTIQVRTLQNHVTQIYRKTGVTTRAGLSDLYHENRLRT